MFYNCNIIPVVLDCDHKHKEMFYHCNIIPVVVDCVPKHNEMFYNCNMTPVALDSDPRYKDLIDDGKCNGNIISESNLNLIVIP